MEFAAAAAGMILWQEGKVIKKLKAAEAFSTESAVKLEVAGITSRGEMSALNDLVRKGKVHKTEDGKYYVDPWL